MAQPKVTPMMAQYLAIKENHRDSILFYRMGDFYEMFFEDAEVASRLLEITLTSRSKKSDSPIPMCGIPVKAVDSYIARLVNKGKKVAICEQVEDAAVAKGIVKRDVVRVITPGMILDDTLLDEKTNNFILSFSRIKETAGISYLDISTGTFRVTESTNLGALVDEAKRVSPSEIVFPESAEMDLFFKPALNAFAEKSISFLDEKAFSINSAKKRLIEQFNTRSLEGFGCEDLTAGVAAAGAILSYVQETQLQTVDHVNNIEPYSLENHLIIDDLSCRNLELVSNLRNSSRQGTMLSVIDNTVTAMGGRLLKRWIRYPLIDPAKINERLDALEEVKNSPLLRQSIREELKSVYDLERLGSKITMGQSNARDFIALKRSLEALPQLSELLKELDSDLFKWETDTEKLSDLSDLIERAIREDAPPIINEGGLIKTGFNDDLDELIRISRDGKGFIAELEAKEREATGISTLKVKFNKVFGYFIEVSKANAKSVPAGYVRKQTLVNAERYITDDLKKYEEKVLGAQDKRASLELEIFNTIKDEVIKLNDQILSAGKFVAGIDCIANLAEVADQNNYCRPDINTDGRIEIKEGRHPVVEKMIEGERYVPNSVKLDNTDNQVIVITGPNMAGKSTVLRQVALLTLLSHMGSFVPATEASICITDRIFTRVGALDNLSQGQSTFMVEMEETANIINNATPSSLIIMDEIGRGTSTFDGLSIAWAIAEYLHDLENKGVKTLFATHYHELTELAESKSRVKNFNIAVKEWSDNIIFLRKLVEGGTNRSYGIQVARLAGVPGKVITRAKKVLSKIENGNHTAAGIDNINGSGDNQQGQRPQVQLSLFDNPETKVMKKLKTIDISNMTPLEALNFLSELKTVAVE